MEEKLIKELLERVVRIETKIDTYNNLRETLNTAVATNNVQDEKLSAIEKRLDKTEDNNKWMWRTLVGAIIVITLNIFFELIKRM